MSKRLIAIPLVMAIILMASCMDPVGPADDEDDRTGSRDIWVLLDYIEVTATVRSNVTGDPLEDAKVTATFHEDSGIVVHYTMEFDGQNNTLGDSGRTGPDGSVTLRLNNRRLGNTTQRAGGYREAMIRSDKDVDVVVEHSDFATITTSRTFSTELVGTLTGYENIRRLYAAKGTMTVYMSPN